MGKVAVTYRIMPESVDLDLDKLSIEVTTTCGDVQIARLEKKPIAFGLKFLELILVMEDRDNNSAELELSFADIKGVQSVEITDLNLL